MIAKRSKYETFVYSLLLAFLIYFIPYYMMSSKLVALIYSVAFTPAMIYVVLMILYGLQKYEYSEKGCTIYLLWRKKFIPGIRSVPDT
jgi:hypothetical protein